MSQETGESESLGNTSSQQEIQSISNKIEREITPEEKIDLADELDIRREDTRSILAKTMIWILGGTYLLSVVVSGLVLFVPVEKEEERTERFTYSKDVFTLLITNQVGLIGAVLGFYFGSSRSKK
ncbi:MAG: hypothetical protein EA365_08755 [Gloeocapsa sp. DLM2.Bin57]|nr:MAG: hypothetical protein EA365_08755 [Gloeocapsa sp. DLM2.Bin57]